MINDLLYASPLDHFFSNLKKKLLKNDYFTCQGGFFRCADFKSVHRICIACTIFVLRANLIGL